MALSVVQIEVKGFDDNFSYLIVEEDALEAALVDPCGDIDKVLLEIETRALKLAFILVTHSHFDHVNKLDQLLKKHDVPVYAHRKSRGRFPIKNNKGEYIEEGDTIKLVNDEIKVMYTPGHIDDAVCYLIEKKYASDDIPKLITGDTVFVEGCGRTTPNECEALYNSIERIKELPDETEIYPGHDYGPVKYSTILYEKDHNKYFFAPDLKAFRQIRLAVQ